MRMLSTAAVRGCTGLVGPQVKSHNAGDVDSTVQGGTMRVKNGTLLPRGAGVWAGGSRGRISS